MSDKTGSTGTVKKATVKHVPKAEDKFSTVNRISELEQRVDRLEKSITSSLGVSLN